MKPEFKAWHKELKEMFLVENLKYLTYPKDEIQLTLVKDSFNEANTRPVQTEIECNIKDIELLTFIGIKDRKNNNKIFVSDIIRLPDGHTGIVKYESGIFFHTAHSEINGMPYWFEKIGNIYENPELL